MNATCLDLDTNSMVECVDCFDFLYNIFFYNIPINFFINHMTYGSLDF